MIFKYNEDTRSVTGILTWIKSLKNVGVNIVTLQPQFNRLNAEMQATGLGAKEAVEKIGGIDKAVVNYCSTTNLAEQTQDGFRASIQQTTITAKVGALAMWAVSKVISEAIKGFDNLIHSTEKCKDRVDKLMSSYKSALENRQHSNYKSTDFRRDKEFAHKRKSCNH